MFKKIFVWLAGLLLLTSLACNFSFSTASVADVQLAKDQLGDEPTTVFDPDDTFYLLVDLDNAPDSTNLRTVWTLVETEGEASEQLLDEVSIESGDDTYFDLSISDGDWPAGEYKVDLYLNDELERTVEFRVEGAPVAAAEPTVEPTEEPTPTPEPTEELISEPTPTKPSVQREEPTAEPDQAIGEDDGTGFATEDVLLLDTFDDNSNGWSTEPLENDFNRNEVAIEDGVYTLSVEAIENSYTERLLDGVTFADFALAADVTPTDEASNYAYGLAFRVDPETGNGYVFEIDNDGFYIISVYDGEWRILKDWMRSGAIRPGETNRLAVVAEGDQLTFFVNGQELTTLTDETVSEGQVGLGVDIFEAETSTDIVVDNFVVLSPQNFQPQPPQDRVLSLPFEAELYTHPSGAFSFPIPQGWEIIAEEPTIGTIGSETSAVGAAFLNAEEEYMEIQMQAFMDAFIDSFLGAFVDDFEVLDQVEQSDGSIFVDASYEAESGEGTAQFFFEQRETVVYVLYFVSPEYDALQQTWRDIFTNYSVDPDAAIAVEQGDEVE